jgi:hypothetical protein
MEARVAVFLNERNQKIDNALAQLLTYDHGHFGRYYDQLNALDLITLDYGSCLITEPVDIEAELRRVLDAVLLTGSAVTSSDAFPVTQSEVFTVLDDFAIDQVDSIIVFVHRVLLSLGRVQVQLRDVKLVGRKYCAT